MKQKGWNEVEGSLKKTQFPAAGAACKATFVLLIGFKMGLLDTEPSSRNKVPNLLPSSIQFNSIQKTLIIPQGAVLL